MTGWRQPLDVGPYLTAVNSTMTSNSSYMVELRPVVNTPVLAGNGPLECSTETALARLPEFIWDVNGYYRDLGFSWPFLGISIKQIREAYLERGGITSSRLTHIVKVMRNRARRWMYDNCWLGQRMVDEEVLAFERRRAFHETRRRRAAGELLGDEDVLVERGIKAREDDTVSEPEQELSGVSSTLQIPWEWTYFQWRTTCDDTRRLARWQELLVGAYVRAGVKRRFCVGFMGRQPRKYATGVIGTVFVVFLNEDVEPSPALARRAVASAL